MASTFAVVAGLVVGLAAGVFSTPRAEAFVTPNCSGAAAPCIVTVAHVTSALNANFIDAGSINASAQVLMSSAATPVLNITGVTDAGIGLQSTGAITTSIPTGRLAVCVVQGAGIGLSTQTCGAAVSGHYIYSDGSVIRLNNGGTSILACASGTASCSAAGGFISDGTAAPNFASSSATVPFWAQSAINAATASSTVPAFRDRPSVHLDVADAIRTFETADAGIQGVINTEGVLKVGNNVGASGLKVVPVTNQILQEDAGVYTGVVAIEAGRVALSAGTATVTFGTAFSHAPICNCTDRAATAAAANCNAAQATQVLVKGAASADVNWICVGPK